MDDSERAQLSEARALSESKSLSERTAEAIAWWAISVAEIARQATDRDDLAARLTGDAPIPLVALLPQRHTTPAAVPDPGRAEDP